MEGKFGKRQESLAPRLFALTKDAADTCRSGQEDNCSDAKWSMDAPGWALSLGITAVSTTSVLVVVFRMKCTHTAVASLRGVQEHL